MDDIINKIAVVSGSTKHRIVCYQDGAVVSYDLAQLDGLAARLATHLRDRGLRAGDRIGILARNRIEWVLLDLAAIKLRLVTAGLEYGRFVPGAELMRAYDLKALFTDHEHDGAVPGVVDIRTLVPAIASTQADLPAAVYADTDITTIKFTSGSTGQPKGLAATVGSINSSIDAVQTMFGHGPTDRLFVFLPLSLLQQRYWIYSALYYGHDVVVSTYELAFHALKRERPTVVMGVPSFFDVIRRQVESKRRTAGGDGAAEPAAALAVRRRELEQMLGDRIRYLWTGSAPANPATLRFFHECGIAIYEGYGLNETCIVTKNHPGACRIGSVGQVVARKQVLIDASGVVVVRSRYPVNTRYLYCGAGESESMFRENGDVVTGDLGYLDDDGYLYITGRADDVIVLGNGKNVKVRAIEERIKTNPAIDECVLFGAGQPYLVAVVSRADGAVDDATVARHIERVNCELDKDERIGKFIVARDGFSIGNGLLTSQYKPRRKEIFRVHRAEIQRAYGVTQ